MRGYYIGNYNVFPAPRPENQAAKPTIQMDKDDFQRGAVRREALRAVEDGNITKYREIVKANPDIFPARRPQKVRIVYMLLCSVDVFGVFTTRRKAEARMVKYRQSGEFSEREDLHIQVIFLE